MNAENLQTLSETFIERYGDVSRIARRRPRKTAKIVCEEFRILVEREDYWLHLMETLKIKGTPTRVQYSHMKLLILLLIATGSVFGDWQVIQGLPPDQKIEVTTRDRTRTRAMFVSATEEALVVRENSGDRSIARANIRKVRIADPGRRTRNGLIWTAVGAGGGAGTAFVLCPYCPNEGNGNIFIGSAIAVGAGLGALTFLRKSYRTIYESK